LKNLSDSSLFKGDVKVLASLYPLLADHLMKELRWIKAMGLKASGKC